MFQINFDYSCFIVVCYEKWTDHTYTDIPFLLDLPPKRSLFIIQFQPHHFLAWNPSVILSAIVWTRIKPCTIWPQAQGLKGENPNLKINISYEKPHSIHLLLSFAIEGRALALFILSSPALSVMSGNMISAQIFVHMSQWINLFEILFRPEFSV